MRDLHDFPQNIPSPLDGWRKVEGEGKKNIKIQSACQMSQPCEHNKSFM